MAAHFFEIWTVRKRRYMKTAFLSSKTAKYFFLNFFSGPIFGIFLKRWYRGTAGTWAPLRGGFDHSITQPTKTSNHINSTYCVSRLLNSKTSIFLKIQKWSIVEVNDSPRGASPIAKKYVIFSRSIKDYSHIHRCSPQVTIWKKN